MAGLLIAVKYPLIFLGLLGLLALFLLLLIWLLPKLWRGIKRIFGAIVRWFGDTREEPSPGSDTRAPEAKSSPDTK